MIIDKEILSKIKITPLLDTLQLEDISDEIYFSKKYSDYISNSRLGILLKDGAKAFFRGFQNQEYSSSFFFGGLLHQQYLQPESYEVVKGVYTPTAKARLMALELYNPTGISPTDDEIKIASYKIGYYKDKLTPSRITELRNKCSNFWRDRCIYEKHNPIKKGDRERIYVDEKSYNLLISCLNSINSNPDFDKLIHPEGIVETPYSANERTILLNVKIEIPEYEPRIFKLKSKLDNFTIDKEENVITVNDLKTTSRLVGDFDPTYFHYQRELGIYSFLLKLCAKKFFNLDNPTVKGNFLVISYAPGYENLIYPMNNTLFKQGFNEFKYLLRIAAYLNIVKGYEFQ